MSLSGGVRRQNSPMTGLFRSSTALSRTVVLYLLALSLLRITANSLQGSMARARQSHPRVESHLVGTLQLISVTLVGKDLLAILGP